MLETIALSMVLWQPPQKSPDFTKMNPPRQTFWGKSRGNRRHDMSERRVRLDMFMEMVKRGDSRADLNKDGKIDGADLEVILDRKMRMMNDNRNEGRRNRQKSRSSCSCKNR